MDQGRLQVHQDLWLPGHPPPNEQALKRCSQKMLAEVDKLVADGVGASCFTVSKQTGTDAWCLQLPSFFGSWASGCSGWATEEALSCPSVSAAVPLLELLVHQLCSDLLCVQPAATQSALSGHPHVCPPSAALCCRLTWC